MTNAVMRERTIRLSLYELNEEDLQIKSKKPLCELASFQTEFALNSIPIAVVTPLLGENIKTNEKQVAFSKIYQLAMSSAPVGVYVSFIHRTKSSSNGGIDRQYWPKSEVCIFKGYLGAPTFNISAFEASATFYIHHWLVALEDISLLTTASSISNPDNVSIASYGFTSGNVPAVWKNVTLVEGVDISNIWETGIKEVFKKVLDWGENNGNKDKLNPFVQRERERMKLVLDKIESLSSEINPDLQNGLLTLKSLIGCRLLKENLPSYINTSAWTKLIQDFAPTFLFSVVPLVDSAKIIPAPCTVDKDKAIELSGNDVFQVAAQPYIAKQISRVVCTADIGSSKANTPVGKPFYVAYGVYPPKVKGVSRNGLLTIVALPEWLSNIIMTPCAKVFPTVYEEVTSHVRTVTKYKAEVAEAAKVQKLVGQAFATHAYLVQAFNATTATVSIPFRMDICPGAMVKVYAKGTKANIELYGTVYSVQVNLVVGSTPATTVLKLTNIRSSHNINDLIENPKDGSGYYKEQWSGEGEVIYGY